MTQDLLFWNKTMMISLKAILELMEKIRIWRKKLYWEVQTSNVSDCVSTFHEQGNEVRFWMWCRNLVERTSEFRKREGRPLECSTLFNPPHTLYVLFPTCSIATFWYRKYEARRGTRKCSTLNVLKIGGIV